MAEAVGHALDDFDLVVDALDEVGAQRSAAVGKNPTEIADDFSHECVDVDTDYGISG